jgi:hypothetical protein
MYRSVGKTEGEFGVTYGCPACIWCSGQEDETPLHVCWNWSYDSNQWDGQEHTYNYVRYCLENNETPTESGLKAAMAQHAELEEA